MLDFFFSFSLWQPSHQLQLALAGYAAVALWARLTLGKPLLIIRTRRFTGEVDTIYISSGHIFPTRRQDYSQLSKSVLPPSQTQPTKD